MRRVLICDDDATLRMLVRATLGSEPDLQIEEAADGEEALEQVRAQPPSLVVLDVAMPRRDGLSTLRALRADPATAGIAVVMLTARAQGADRDAAMDAGADAFMAKPFSPVELRQLVRGLLPASG